MSKIRSLLARSLTLAFVMASACGYYAYTIQATANNHVSGCSYLDPITVDIVAFLAGMFLIIEAFIDIIKHKDSLVRKQITRCIRMSFGTSIVVIHVMQFIHK